MVKTMMNRQTTLLVWFMAAVFLSFTASAQKMDGIVAVVDEDVILQSELDAALNAIKMQIQQSGQQLPPEDVLQEQVLERLINTKLQVSRATQSGIRISDAMLDNALSNIAGRNGVSLSQMRQTVVADGFSWRQFRENVREQMITTELRNRVAKSNVDVTETEIDIHLASNANNNGEVKLGHILIAVPEASSPEEISEREALAQSVYQRLQNGADFASTAIEVSDGQKALDGGDLGWRPADQLPAFIAEQLTDLEVGATTSPTRSQAGFHIFKLADRRENDVLMVEEHNMAHIMIRVTELVSNNEALEKADRIYDQLESGAEFNALAAEHSDDGASSNLGGDLGWFPPGTYGPQFQSVFESLNDGEYSQPFQTEAGWHILMRKGVRSVDRSEEMAREQAREAIFSRKADEEVQRWLRQLRAEAFVEKRLDG